MKNILRAMLLSALLGVGGSAFAEVPIVFCENFSDTFEPVNPGTEFEGSQVSWMAVFEEPLGRSQIQLSIYQNDPANNSQALLSRGAVDINPKWAAYGIRHADFINIGSYDVAIETLDGQTLAYGKVSLVEAKEEIEPQPEEHFGATLKELFDRYAPK